VRPEAGLNAPPECAIGSFHALPEAAQLNQAVVARSRWTLQEETREEHHWAGPPGTYWLTPDSRDPDFGSRGAFTLHLLVHPQLSCALGYVALHSQQDLGVQAPLNRDATKWLLQDVLAAHQRDPGFDQALRHLEHLNHARAETSRQESDRR